MMFTSDISSTLCHALTWPDERNAFSDAISSSEESRDRIPVWHVETNISPGDLGHIGHEHRAISDLYST